MKIILLCGLVMFVLGLEISLSGLMLDKLMYSYEMDEFEKYFADSVFYISIGIGSIFSGFITEKGRKPSISIVLFVSFISTLLCSIQQIYIFILLRMIIGLGLGIISPMIYSILCESLLPNYRAFWLTFVSMFVCIGSYFSTLMVSTFYYFELENPSPTNYFTVLSIPILITDIMILILLDESPRFLITRRKHEEAFILIENISQNTLSAEIRNRIIKEISHQNKHLDFGIKSLFNNNYKNLTIILCCIWIFYSYLLNSLYFNLLIGLLYSSSLFIDYSNSSYGDRFPEQSYFYGFLSIIYLIAALLTSVRCCGRKRLISSGFLLVAIISGANFFYGNLIGYYLLVALYINISMNAMNAYSCEIYPTKIRDNALGLFYCLSRVSGFISNLLILILSDDRKECNIFLNFIIGLLGFVLTLKLPLDTYGKTLDTNIEYYSEKVEVTLNGESKLSDNNDSIDHVIN
jgi:hypothetical protein